MPQHARRFWRLLDPDLFVAESEDGRRYHLECVPRGR